ncbi:MAG: hypothetical protein CMD13_02170 [Flavobacteriales bacterium]|nr:hypothetical protein [Flavobacteriales bacterium]
MFAFDDGRPWKTANSEDIKKYNEEHIIKSKDEPKFTADSIINSTTINKNYHEKYNEFKINKTIETIDNIMPNEEIKPCDFCKQKITMHAMKYSFHGESQREKNIRMNCNLCWECYSNATYVGKPIPTYD